MQEVIFIDQYGEKRLIINDTVIACADSIAKQRFFERLTENGVIINEEYASELHRKKKTKKEFLVFLARQGVIQLIIVDFNLEYNGDKIQSIKARCIRQDEPDEMNPCFKKGVIYTMFVDINGQLTLNDENGDMHTVATVKSRNWEKDDFFPKYFEILK